MKAALTALATRLAGSLHVDETTRRLYATDASEYQELPAAVALPRSEDDIRALLRFAREHGVGVIPRTAGTSLAGQVVGDGIVVDVGRHLNHIVALDVQRRRVRVQPGVVRNELNIFLKPHGLFFAPETSTANRAMIGGMVGNNSCGANSIVYGSTRDHLVSARGFLSDGSEVAFGPLTAIEFEAKCADHGASSAATLETQIYRAVRNLLGNAGNRRLIQEGFPKPAVTRRNTGYALDALMDCSALDPDSTKAFNLCRLIAGSEGTLFLGVEFELNCEPLPPPAALMCAHFASVQDALHAVEVALRHQPHAVELIDRGLLDLTKANLEQARNRSFVLGDPGAVLAIEIRRDGRSTSDAVMRAIEEEFRTRHLGYAFPVLWGNDGDRVWELRRAAQGVMSNAVGDAKPRQIVEDTAVAVGDLPDYIADFDRLMREKYGLACVYYGHAGAGELHMRPLFCLKTAAGLRMFRSIGKDVALLVKKYRGSLSGEHGDGRLRGELVPLMVGRECYTMMRRIKDAFDPLGVLNPGKIIDTPPMDTSLRYYPGRLTPTYETIFQFRDTDGVVRAAEKCNGSGDCRKSHLMGGTMCPSFMATRDEQHTTRARANVLRQMLTEPRNPARPFDSQEISAVMSLCLSCKGCKSECPSNVDMARLKAEWLQHWHDSHGTPLRTRLVGNYSNLSRFGMLAPRLHNWVVTNRLATGLLRLACGFAQKRSLPCLPPTTLRLWHATHANRAGSYPNGRLYLFCDEFTNYHDAQIGADAVSLLNGLGYEVLIPPHVDSGRAQFSKGLLRQARDLAIRNVELLADIVSADAPLVGVEPSAILGFRDEYPDIVPDRLVPAAQALAPQALLLEEFIAREADHGKIRPEQFTSAPREIKLHGHCQQKALASIKPTIRMLSLPANYRVTVINSGCCGMAGSFGYEAEHFDLSMKIGELVLFPAVRALPADIIVAAPGTSCRHQIKDGTGRVALHPVQILRAALIAAGHK